MGNLIHPFNRALFEPFGVLIWLAAAYILWRHDKKALWKPLLGCFFLMILWRFAIIRAKSSRYYLNLLFPALLLIMEAGRLFCQREILFSAKVRRSLVSVPVIVLFCVCIGKNFHNNSYRNHFKNALQFVQNDMKISQHKKAFLFARRKIYLNRIAGNGQIVTGHMDNIALKRPGTFFYESRNLPYPAYFFLDERSFTQTVPNKEYSREKKILRCITRLRKNRRKNHFLAIYKLSFLPDGKPVMKEKEDVRGREPADPQNLLLNGDFQQLSPLVLSEARKKFFSKNRIDTIRESSPFPDQWTIESTPGYWFNSAPVVKIVFDPTLGKNGLLLQCRSLITILNKQFFDTNSYLLEFDVIGDGKSIFSIAFHEFQKNKYQYTRHGSLVIPKSGQIYHVALPLFKEDFHLTRFKLCFELQTGKIQLSNIKMKKLNREHRDPPW